MTLAEKDEQWWDEWLERTGRSLGAKLAETIGTRPSRRASVRALVNGLIQIEQDVSSGPQPEDDDE